MVIVPYLPDKVRVLPDEAVKGSQSFLLQSAKGKIYIYLVDIQLEAEDGMKVYGDIHQHIDIIGEALAGKGLKITDADGAFSPCFCLHLCNEGIGGGIL